MLVRKIIILLIIILFPFKVNALNYNEALDIFNNFPNEISLNVVNPEKYIDSNLKDEEDINYFYSYAIKSYFKDKSYDENDVYILMTSINKAHVIVNYYLENGNHEIFEKDINVKYVDNYDKNIFNKASKIIDLFKDNYTLKGMFALNSIYHYNGFLDDYKNRAILARFPEIRFIMEMNPWFRYEIVSGRGGGSPLGDEKYTAICLYYGDILYAYKETLLTVENLIYVDKNTDGDIFEKAENRINRFYNNSIKVSLDRKNFTIFENEPEIDKYINKQLGTNDSYKVYFTNLNIGKKSFDVSLIEVDKNKLDNYYFNSIDINTNIEVYSESYDVPLDSSIKTENVLSKDYVVSFMNNNNIDLKYAFDLNLIKAYDNDFVTKMEKGIEVYIPVNNYNIGEKVTIYNIKDDSSMGDKIIGEVVLKDNKMYLKFTTHHFSTYAFGEIKNISNVVKTTTNIKKKSNNKYLSSIKLSIGDIKFNKKVLNYELKVNNEVEKISIDAKVEDNKSIVKGTGNYNLIEGNNLVKLTVIAEDGSESSYTILIYREKGNEIVDNNDNDTKNEIRNNKNDLGKKQIIILVSIITLIVVSLVLIYKRK